MPLLNSIKSELKKNLDKSFDLNSYDDSSLFFFKSEFDKLNFISYRDIYDFIDFIEAPEKVKFSNEDFYYLIKSLPLPQFNKVYVSFTKNLFRKKIKNGSVTYSDFIDLGKAFLIEGNINGGISNFRKGIYFSSDKNFARSEILDILLSFNIKPYKKFIEEEISPYLLKDREYDFLVLEYYVKGKDERAYDFIFKVISEVEPEEKVDVIDYLVEKINGGQLNRLRVLTELRNKNKKDGFLKLFAFKLLGLKNYDLGFSKNYYFQKEYYREKFKSNFSESDLNVGFNLFFREPWFKLAALNYWDKKGEYGKILAFFDYELVTSYVFSTGYYYGMDTFLDLRNSLGEGEIKVLDGILYRAFLNFSLNDVSRSYFKKILPEGFGYLSEIREKKEKEIVRFIMGEE